MDTPPCAFGLGVPGARWSSSGRVARGDAERSGQRLPSSYPGFEVRHGNTVHTVSCPHFCGQLGEDAALAFACQRFVCKTDTTA